MKIGLFLALLVLLASTNVFGQDEVKKVGRKNRPSSNEIAANQDEFEQNNHSRDSQHDTNTPDQAVHDVDTVLPEEPTSNRIKLVQKADVSVNVPSTDRQPFVKKPASKFEGITTKKVTKPEEGIPKQRVEVKPIVADHEVEPEAHADEHVTPSDTENHADESRVRVKPTDTKPSVKPSKAFHETNRPGSQSDDLRNDDEIVVEEVKPLKSVVPKRISQDSFVLENTVHVSGSIALTRYRPLAIDSVQYETKGGRLNSNSHGSMKARLSASQDYVAPQSRVVLYVATVKTIDRKLAFANFSIGLAGDHFPLAFNVHVPLPNELLGLVETADITLYFFAYVTNADSRIDAFLPDGTSQILLQGTNRVVQQLQINVKANGMEIKGLFRGRYSQRYIRTGTAFQVLIVPEQSLSRLLGESIESIAQFTINNVPAMYPVPFSLLVPHQELKPKTKYYAIAYIFENGVERLIKQKAILVINENKVLVTPDISFTIVPHPFILHGTVARAMPGPFYFEPNSSIILSLHEKDSDSPAFTFRLPIIAKLPQDIQVNISQASQFDATKDYEILAMVTDDKNRIYMTSLQKIPILDQMSRLTIPVDDFFYYVQVRLHSPVSQQLTYIPGSKASLIVTENPETTGTPIFDAQFDPTTPDFREYLMKIPITRAQRYRNAYLILLINNTGIITHVSKILLISNNQPPPLRIELPVIPLNLIRGFIHDSENRVAQWSSSSYANLYLLDDQIASPEKAIVQTWKIHLEREFPVRFEVPVEFSRLLPGHKYSLQSTIENGPAVFEYKPANSVSVIEPDQRIKDNLRVLVKNVKKSQFVNGLIYISDVPEPLQEHGQLIIQLSSSPSLTAPEIIHETRLDVEKRRLPVNFTMELPLDHIDISSVYYFLVQYVIGNTVVVPVTQAFAFSPRNEATVVLRLTKTRQIRITGQVSSTGGRLVLPIDSTLHLYITDNPQSDKSFIYSDVRLQASTNSQYQFTMYLDAVILQRNITLYLRADILHQKAVLLSIPRPALLQITPGGEWNINLVLDLPTLLVGQITSSGQQEDVHGEFEVYIQVLPRGTNNVVRTSRLRLAATLPQPFRVEIENELFVEYPELEVRALIKNCKEEILFKSGGAVDIHTRLNVDLNLPVVITDLNKLKELSMNTAVSAPLQAGQWRLSVTGIVPGTEAGVMATLDNGLIPQK